MLPIAQGGSPDELLIIGSLVAAFVVYRFARGPARPGGRKGDERSEERQRSRSRR